MNIERTKTTIFRISTHTGVGVHVIFVLKSLRQRNINKIISGIYIRINCGEFFVTKEDLENHIWNIQKKYELGRNDGVLKNL